MASARSTSGNATPDDPALKDENGNLDNPELSEAVTSRNDAEAALAQAQQSAQDAAAAHQATVDELNARLAIAEQRAQLAEMASAAQAGAPVVQPKEDYDPAVDGYVVLTDVITLTVGTDPLTRKSEARRFVKGAAVYPIKGTNDAQIARLLQLKAIAPNDGVPKVRTSARVAALAAGAAMDEVAATPIVAFAPQALPSQADAEAAQARADADAQAQIAADQATAQQAEADAAARAQAEAAPTS